MSWGAIVAGGVGIGTTIYGASQQKKAVGKATDLSQEASEEALARSSEAFGQAEAALTPYARQEQAASTQLMAQMGLSPPTGGTQPGTGGGGWGFGAAPTGEAGGNLDNVIQEMLTQQQVLYKRSGYSGSNIHREAAQRVSGMLEELKKSGQLPANFQMPSTTDLVSQAKQIEDNYGGHTKMAKNLYPGLTSDTFDLEKDVGGLLQKYDVMPRVTDTMGGPGAEGGPGQMGEGGPSPQTAADIMKRAGVEGLPPELQEQFMQDLMADPQQDPELAEYLGLTPESMDVGQTYQDTQAYRGAIEAGTRAVNQGSATTGSLYSGRRGLALRDVGQEVEQGFYMDAADRQQQMMQARRGERAAGIARRGIEVGSGREREQSYYNNYMQMLTSLSNPTTTTNIEQMRQGSAQAEGANIMGTARDAGNLGIASASANQAAMADVAGGVMQMGSSWIDRQQQPGGGG